MYVAFLLKVRDYMIAQLFLIVSLLVGGSAFAQVSKADYQLVVGSNAQSTGYKDLQSPTQLRLGTHSGSYFLNNYTFGEFQGGSYMKFFVPPGVLEFKARYVGYKSIEPAQGSARLNVPPVTNPISITQDLAYATANAGGDPHGGLFNETILKNILTANKEVYFYGPPESGGMAISYGGEYLSPVPTSGGYLYVWFRYPGGRPISSTFTFIVDKACYENWFANARWDVNGNPDENATHTCSGSSGGVPPVSDTIPPAFVNAATSDDGRKVIMTYGEALSSATAAGSSFVVHVNGSPVAVSSVAIGNNNRAVELSLAAAVTHGQHVTVQYTDPSVDNDSNAVQDAAGNDASSLPSIDVTNNVLAPAVPEGLLYPLHNDELSSVVPKPDRIANQIVLRWREANSSGSGTTDHRLPGKFPGYPASGLGDSTEFSCVELGRNAQSSNFVLQPLLGLESSEERVLTIKTPSPPGRQQEIVTRVTCWTLDMQAEDASFRQSTTPPIRIKTDGTWELALPTAEAPILDDPTGETAKFQLYVPRSGGVELPVVVMLYVPLDATGDAAQFRGASAFVVNTPDRFVIYNGTQNDNDLILARVADNAPSRVIEVDTGVSRNDLRSLQVRAHVFYRDLGWWTRLTNDSNQWFVSPAQ